MAYAFEKLEVWQKSRLLVKIVYRVTQSFPTEERYGLTSQLRRASVSVSSNIAEGSTRWSKKDKARFYEIAYGSLIEVMNQLILSTDLGFLNDEELDVIKPQIAEISRMLDALYKSAKNS
jgi:four helix bundle protein